MFAAWRWDYRHLVSTVRVLPRLAVSTVMVVAARKALFLVSGGQLTRSRSPHATRIDASKSATKLARQIIAGPRESLRYLLVPMLLGSCARLGDRSPKLLYRIERLVVVSSRIVRVTGFVLRAFVMRCRLWGLSGWLSCWAHVFY